MLAGGSFESLERVLYLSLKALGKLLGFEVMGADAAGDGEAGRDGDADRGHLGKPCTLAAEDLLHGCRAIGAALAKEVDQRLGVGSAHAGVAISGAACRRRSG